LQFPDGVLAQVHLSWLAPTKLRRTTLSGSKQMIVYDDTLGPEAIKIFGHGVDRPREPQTFGEFHLTYRTGDIQIPHLENREPLSNEWAHFENCCRTRRAPLSDGRLGAQVVAIIEAAEESLRTGARVRLDRTEARHARA
ncbi:MAG TPA: hypothetical protein V6D47_19485, partial [Oscillatoriaceae cyanobacterium]